MQGHGLLTLSGTEKTPGETSEGLTLQIGLFDASSTGIRTVIRSVRNKFIYSAKKLSGVSSGYQPSHGIYYSMVL